MSTEGINKNARVYGMEQRLDMAAKGTKEH